MIKFKKRARAKEFGFSLVESLIAIALLSIVAVSFTVFSSTRMSQIKNSHFAACLQRSQDIVDKIKSTGAVKSVNVLSYGGSEGSMSRSAPTSMNMLNFISNDQDWLVGNAELFRQDGATLYLRNHKALIGSMSLLNSLYNSDPNFCTNPDGIVYNNVGTAELVETLDVGHLRNIQSKIRIQAINLVNGNLSCPTLPLSIRPAGVDISSSQTADFMGGDILPELNSVANLGFLVTVNTSYTDSDDNNSNCDASSVFNYPKIPPSDTDLLSPTVNISTGPLGTCTQTLEPEVQIRFNPEFKTEKAIALVCRDSSGSPVASNTKPLCPGGPIRTPVLPNDGWKSCKTVTLCGRSADSFVELPNGFNLSFSGISLGCSPRIEVVAVDAAHNISRTPIGGGFPAVALPSCTSCPASYTGPGYCANGGGTQAAGCVYSPPPPPTFSDGDGSDGDGGDQGMGSGFDGDDGGTPSSSSSMGN